MVISLTMVIISLCMCISDQHVVDLKLYIIYVKNRIKNVLVTTLKEQKEISDLISVVYFI